MKQPTNSALWIMAGVAAGMAGTFPARGAEVPFTERVISTTADAPNSVFAVDVDGDGDTDVLSASFRDDKIAWYENDGGSPPTFTERVISNTANGAASVFAMDVDGDGDTDVLSASGNDDKIAWYENDGGSPPTFTERVISTTANGAKSVFATDLDGDGDIDVLSASFFDDKIAWYENDGGSPPIFTERVISITANGAASVFAMDVDGDGDIDVLSASLEDDKIAWYESDGGSPPTFTERVISISADRVLSVFAMDLDGDGDTDVLSASYRDDKIAWYENDGGSPPSFTERVISTAADGANSVFAMDMDGDGDTDVLSASSTSTVNNKIAWYENTAPPVMNLTTGRTFQTIEAAINAAGNGDVIASTVPRFEAEGTIDFSGKSISLQSLREISQPQGGIYRLADGASLEAAPGHGITLEGELLAPPGADANLSADTLTVSESGALTVGTGAGLFISDVHEARVGGTTRLDPSGFMTFAGDLTLGGVPPTFTERVISTTADAASSVFATDLDGDGDTDVLSASQLDDKIAWYESDGGSPPTFTERVISTFANGARSVSAIDVDGDGDTDVLSASQFDDKIAWYQSDGGSPPSFTERVISTTADGAFSVFAIDLDGDGDTDVLSASLNDDKIAWYDSDGGSPPSFTERVISTTANGANSVFATDVDGDGDIDVLSTSQFDDKIVWYESDGGSPPTFTERVISTTADYALSVFATDLDGDGDIDVLSASFVDNKIAWYESDGGSPPSFTERVISTTADNAQSVHATDVDGDGDIDVLSASQFDDKIAWYENDGGSPPTFIEHVISITAVAAVSVFATDLDGDGDTDVLSVQNEGEIAWYETVRGSVSLSIGSVLSAEGTVKNTLPLTLFGGVIASGTRFTNTGAGILTGFGDIDADVTNDALVSLVDDTRVNGDYLNNGTTVIQNGTLTILGSLINNGLITGGDGGGALTAMDDSVETQSTTADGLTVIGDYIAGPGASLMMGGEEHTVKVGGHVDLAFSDNNAFDMANATLQLVGLPGETQRLEVMSSDIGDTPNGFDRTQSGHFPIGTLHIGPTAATVRLADVRDNDGQGQDLPEALYVRRLIVDATATLVAGGFKIYYGAIDTAGTITNSELLDQVVFRLGDHNVDGRIDDLDTLGFVECMTGPAVDGVGLGCEVVDFNQNNRVDLRDFAAYQRVFKSP